MAIFALTPEVIQSGRELIEHMDRHGIKPDGAGWMVDHDRIHFRLYLALSELNTQSYHRVSPRFKLALAEMRVRWQPGFGVEDDSIRLVASHSVLGRSIISRFREPNFEENNPVYLYEVDRPIGSKNHEPAIAPAA